MNLELVKDIYGEDIFKLFIENKETVINNIKFLKTKDITIIEDIIERYAIILLFDEIDFKNRIEYLINKLGDNYNEQLEENVDLLEEIM